MSTTFFTLQDFLDYESDSANLDFLINPNNIEFAKDPSQVIINNSINITRLISLNGILNTWGFEDNNSLNIINTPKSQTLENALAALFFYLNDEEQKAKNIFHFYLDNIPPTFTANLDKQIPDSFDLNNLNTRNNTLSKSVAYMLYVVSYYISQSNNTQYLPLARFCVQQLLDLKNNTFNLIKESYSSDICFLETNVIAFFGLKTLARFVNEGDIQDFSNIIKSNLINQLGIKDNTSNLIYTPISTILGGIFALSVGENILLNQAKSQILNFRIFNESRNLGIGSSGILDIKQTMLASIFYFRYRQPSKSFAYNTAILEKFLSFQGFQSNINSSSTEQALWFLILNKIIQKTITTGEFLR